MEVNITYSKDLSGKVILQCSIHLINFYLLPSSSPVLFPLLSLHLLFSSPCNSHPTHSSFSLSSSSSHSQLLHALSPNPPSPPPSLAAFSMIISGIGVLLIWWLPAVESITVILSCVFSGFSIIGWNALDVLSVEYFPTHLRYVYTHFQAMHVCTCEYKGHCTTTCLMRPLCSATTV